MCWILIGLMALAFVGCSGELDESCSANSAGCKPGLYCQGELGGTGFWSANMCESYYEKVPIDGVCRVVQALGDSCNGFRKECGAGFCKNNRCVDYLPEPLPVSVCTDGPP